MSDNPLEMLGGRGIAGHVRPIRWYLDDLFSGKEVATYELNGVEYRLKRVGPDHVCPEGPQDPALEFKINKKLEAESIKKGYEWKPETAAEQINFALAESMERFASACR